MTRTFKFPVHGAFYRLEARATQDRQHVDRWRVKVYRNGSFVAETEGPPHLIDDRALASAYEAAQMLAKQGIWEPGATRHLLFPRWE